MVNGLEAGREGERRAEETGSGALWTLKLPTLSFLFPTGINAFPCCGKDSVDIVERT